MALHQVKHKPAESSEYYGCDGTARMSSCDFKCFSGIETQI
jgi:hypothetical protein